MQDHKRDPKPPITMMRSPTKVALHQHRAEDDDLPIR